MACGTLFFGTYYWCTGTYFDSLLGFSVILAGSFLLGFLLSRKPVRSLLRHAAHLAKNSRRKIAGLIIGAIVFIIASLVLAKHHNGFVTEHRYEMFWLVVFPAIMFSPFIIGYLASRLRA